MGLVALIDEVLDAVDDLREASRVVAASQLPTRVADDLRWKLRSFGYRPSLFGSPRWPPPD